MGVYITKDMIIYIPSVAWFGGMNMDLKEYTNTERSEQTNTMDLRAVSVGESHEVTFHAIREVRNGLIAEVSSETLPGNVLWLRGSYGPQNGLLSLANCCADPTGQTVTYEKVASEKSPAGYAHRWFIPE